MLTNILYKFLFFQNYKKTLKKHLSFTLIIILLASCAKIVAPTGGPPDRKPPELLKVLPENKTINFNSKEIVFTFDEFFTLKNPMQNLYLNPLHDENIEYRIRNKNLIVKVPSNLQNDQTYNLVLQNTVADFNEGNLLPILNFQFSKNNFLDSLNFNSKVLDAFTLKPIENVQLYLIPYPADSALLKKQFAYFAISNIDGSFEFKNIKSGKYELFALEEKNRTHVNTSTENRIGFSSLPYTLEKRIINDTSYNLTTSAENPIFLFQEKDSIMRIIKSERVRKGLHEITFNNKFQSIKINHLNSTKEDSIIVVPSISNKSINVWFLNQKSDIAELEVVVDKIIVDTITMNLKPAGRGKAQIDTISSPTVKLHNIVNNNNLLYSENLKIWVSNPISSYHNSEFLIITEEDTISPKIIFNENFPNILEIEFDKKEIYKFNIILKDSSITDIFNLKTDSVKFDISILHLKDLGNIVLKLDTFDFQNCYLFELINSKEEVVRSINLSEYQNTLDFEGLIPDDYIVRVTEDRNCNMVWDTGNFTLRLQPERLIISEFKITVKANWTNETLWSINF